MVEINKTDPKSPTEAKKLPPKESETSTDQNPNDPNVRKRPSTLHLCKNGTNDENPAEEQAEKLEKTTQKPQNLDEIVTMGKSDSELENIPATIKLNGAQHVECRPSDAEEHGGFFSLSRAFCCLRTTRSS